MSSSGFERRQNAHDGVLDDATSFIATGTRVDYVDKLLEAKNERRFFGLLLLLL